MTAPGRNKRLIDRWNTLSVDCEFANVDLICGARASGLELANPLFNGSAPDCPGPANNFNFEMFFTMAAQATEKDNMEPRLLALFQNAGVPNDQLDSLARVGVTSVSLFTHVVDSAAELRPFLVKALNLNHNDPNPQEAINCLLYTSDAADE